MPVNSCCLVARISDLMVTEASLSELAKSCTWSAQCCGSVHWYAPLADKKTFVCIVCAGADKVPLVLYCESCCYGDCICMSV